MRVIFMGTPEFAVPSLKILVESGINVVAVVTATDKHGGRGGKRLIESAIKKYALAEELPILQPANLKASSFISKLSSYKADIQIVVAFRMLPEIVWNMPSEGTYNLHGSLLPQYRGAAPIHWAVVNGEKETGVTSFKLKHEIDTGDLLFQEKLSIGNEETTGEVYARLMELGASVVLKTVRAISEGNVELKPQDNSKVSKAPKINREIAEVNWDQTCEELRNFVRGMNPFPGAWFRLGEANVKLHRCSNRIASHNIAPGHFISDNKNYLHVTTKDGFSVLEELQLQGKKRMDIKSLLNGTDMSQMISLLASD